VDIVAVFFADVDVGVNRQGGQQRPIFQNFQAKGSPAGGNPRPAPAVDGGGKPHDRILLRTKQVFTTTHPSGSNRYGGNRVTAPSGPHRGVSTSFSRGNGGDPTELRGRGGEKKGILPKKWAPPRGLPPP